MPPAPTPQDEYPGYYRLPSGKWAAYDPVYYQGFYQKWQADYDKYVRDLEKGKIKGFEELDEENATGVNAMEEMARTREEIQVKEERKALTQAKDQTAAPRMNIKGAALSGRARTRGQLATLLTEAYQNREAYEDRIAQGRRNRKEAGNKYGEWTSPTFHPRPLMPNHRLLTRARPSQLSLAAFGLVVSVDHVATELVTSCVGIGHNGFGNPPLVPPPAPLSPPYSRPIAISFRRRHLKYHPRVLLHTFVPALCSRLPPLLTSRSWTMPALD